MSLGLGRTADPAPISAPTRGLGYVAALDGLRGLAVALVLVFHQDPSWLPGGYLGVSAFFTLSGFLITRLLLVEHHRTGTIGLGAFWGRRIRRLWPASLLCAFVVVVVSTAGGQGTATQLQGLRGDAIASLTSLANWRFIATGGGYGALLSAPSPFQHFWSLAIEEQFYLVFPPLLLVLLGRRGHHAPPDRAKAVAALASLTAAGIATGWVLRAGSSGGAYYDTAARVPELLIGCLLALLLHEREPVRRLHNRVVLAAASAAALFGLAWMWTHVTAADPALFHGLLPLHAALVAVVILAAVQPRAPIPLVLSWEPLRALGAISYGVYLFHWPVFLWLGADVVHAEGVALFLVRVVATLTAALLSFRLLELPVRTLRFGGTVVLRRALPAAAVVVLLVAVLATRNPPQGTSAKVALREEVSRAPVSVTPGSTVPDSPLGRPIKLVFAGDSLGYQLELVFIHWSLFFPGRFDVGEGTAQPGCGMVSDGELVQRDYDVRKNTPVCRKVVERNTARVNSIDPDLFVVVTGPWDIGDRQLPGEDTFRSIGDPVLDAFLQRQFQNDIDAMTAKGAQVVWVNWPCIQPVDTLPDGGPLPSGFKEAKVEHLNRVIIPALARANPLTVQVVDLSKSLCPGGRFQRTNAKGETLRADDGMHMTPEGGALAREQLVPRIFTAAKRVVGRGTVRSVAAVRPAPGGPARPRP